MDEDITLAWEKAVQTYYNTYCANPAPLVEFLDHPDITAEFFKDFATETAPYLYGGGEPEYLALARKIATHPLCTESLYRDITRQLEIQWWGDDPVQHSHLLGALHAARVDLEQNL